MSFDEGLYAWVQEALEPVGAVAMRRMMGAAVLYLDGTVFAVLDAETLWFKSDAESDAIWDAEGCERFTFSSKEGRTITVAARSRFSVNQPEAVVAAACEGRGIVGVLSHQVDSELQTGALVRILEAFEPAPLPVSLVWPSSRRSWRRIRLLIDHLAGALSALAVLRGVLGPSPTRRRPAYRRPITEE